jgi:hypothetical protein
MKAYLRDCSLATNYKLRQTGRGAQGRKNLCIWQEVLALSEIQEESTDAGDVDLGNDGIAWLEANLSYWTIDRDAINLAIRQFVTVGLLKKQPQQGYYWIVDWIEGA